MLTVRLVVIVQMFTDLLYLLTIFDVYSLLSELHQTHGIGLFGRSFGQAWHWFKEQRRAASVGLNSCLTYVTLPWHRIIGDVLDNTRTPVLTFWSVLPWSINHTLLLSMWWLAINQCPTDNISTISSDYKIQVKLILTRSFACYIPGEDNST